VCYNANVTQKYFKEKVVQNTQESYNKVILYIEIIYKDVSENEPFLTS